MKKWGVHFIIILLGVALIGTWQERIKTKYIVNILESIPSVDLIIVKDSETDKRLFEYTSKDAFFSEMVEIYEYPYYELKQSEKKLVNKDPVYVIEFLQDNAIQYKVNVYELKEDDKDVLADKGLSTEKENHTYVFALEKYHHLVGVNPI